MTYEYLCEACGHAWEAQQPISAEPLKDCPSCGQPKAKRQISRGAGFILKGGGWYSDLYSSSRGDSGAKPSGDSSSSGGESSGASSAAPAATSTSMAKETSSAPATTGSSTKSD